MPLTETKAKPKTPKTELSTKVNKEPEQKSDIIDVDLSEIQKKKFRLDRDNNRVIELNTSDITVIGRLEEIYPKMLKLVEDAQVEGTSESEEILSTLMNVDAKMRELLDYAFDSKVAEKTCPSGSLFDPINGKFRFEYIIEKLVNLYDENFKNEFSLMQNRLNKHTSKYTKSNKRK